MYFKLKSPFSLNRHNNFALNTLQESRLQNNSVVLSYKEPITIKSMGEDFAILMGEIGCIIHEMNTHNILQYTVSKYVDMVACWGHIFIHLLL